MERGKNVWSPQEEEETTTKLCAECEYNTFLQLICWWWWRGVWEGGSVGKELHYGCPRAPSASASVRPFNCSFVRSTPVQSRTISAVNYLFISACPEKEAARKRELLHVHPVPPDKWINAFPAVRAIRSFVHHAESVQKTQSMHQSEFVLLRLNQLSLLVVSAVNRFS